MDVVRVGSITGYDLLILVGGYEGMADLITKTK
jgi:hypothetical protein